MRSLSCFGTEPEAGDLELKGYCEDVYGGLGGRFFIDSKFMWRGIVLVLVQACSNAGVYR